MHKKPSGHVHVLFPPELHQRLSEYSQANGASMGSLIRDAVEQVYFANGKNGEEQERLTEVVTRIDEQKKQFEHLSLDEILSYRHAGHRY